MKYEKNEHVSHLSYIILLKSSPDITKVLRSLIATRMKEGYCYDACNFVQFHCNNGSYLIQCIGFDQSYSIVVHSDSFKINIDINNMHRFIDMILNISNNFQNTNIPMNEKACVTPSTYYIDWFEKFTPMLLSI